MNFSQYTGIAMIVYIAASVAWMVYALTGGKIVNVAATAVAALAFTAHTAAVSSRVIESGRLPLTNTYETLLLFSWILALLTIWLQGRWRVRAIGAFAFPLVFLLLAATSRYRRYRPRLNR